MHHHLLLISRLDIQIVQKWLLSWTDLEQMRCRCLARYVFPVYAGLGIMTSDSCFYYCSSENITTEQDQSIKVSKPNSFQLLALLCCAFIQTNVPLKCVLNWEDMLKCGLLGSLKNLVYILFILRSVSQTVSFPCDVKLSLLNYYYQTIYLWDSTLL